MSGKTDEASCHLAEVHLLEYAGDPNPLHLWRALLYWLETDLPLPDVLRQYLLRSGQRLMALAHEQKDRKGPSPKHADIAQALGFSTGKSGPGPWPKYRKDRDDVRIFARVAELQVKEGKLYTDAVLTVAVERDLDEKTVDRICKRFSSATARDSE